MLTVNTSEVELYGIPVAKNRWHVETIMSKIDISIPEVARIKL